MEQGSLNSLGAPWNKKLRISVRAIKSDNEQIDIVIDRYHFKIVEYQLRFIKKFNNVFIKTEQ